MALQAKQMRIGTRKGFPNNSERLVLLANGNRFEFD